MSTRSTRRSTANAAEPDIDTLVLTNIDNLILAQAVWELGSNSWSAVARLLSKHPLLSRPKSFFTTQSCHAMYNHLMKEAGLECTEANHAIHAPLNLKLAQRHYHARVDELRELIVTEETNFKTIIKEIDEIRSGLWDEKIKTKITGVPIRESIENGEPEVVIPEITPTDEVFGSELSGVTDSVSQHSQPRSEPASNGHPTGHPETVEADVVAQEPSRETSQELEEIPTKTEDGNLQEDASAESPNTLNALSQMIIDNPHSPGKDEDETLTTDENAEATFTDAAPAPSNDASFELSDLNVPSDLEAPNVSVSVKLTEDWEQERGKEREHEQGTEQEQRHEPDQDPHSELERELEQESESMELDPRTAGEAVEDEGVTSGEEPLHVTRRSSRRRRSSVSPAVAVCTRNTKTRRQRRVSQETELSQLVMEVEAETSVADNDERSKGKRNASFIEGTESPRDKKRARDESEPAEEDEPGPSSGPSRRRRDRPPGNEGQAALKRFQYVIGLLHSQISQHRNGNIFHNPIKNSEAPDYHDIVKRAIDLKTIKAKTKDGVIATSLEFQRDIYLMFANAMMYNRPGSDIYTMAEDMMLESEAYIHTFRQTEGLLRGTHR